MRLQPPDLGLFLHRADCWPEWRARKLTRPHLAAADAAAGAAERPIREHPREPLRRPCSIQHSAEHMSAVTTNCPIQGCPRRSPKARTSPCAGGYMDM